MSLARLLPFLLQWTNPAGGVEHEHLPCWPLSCLGHSLRRGACAERRGGSHGLNSSLRDSTCGARTSCSTLACDGRTRASAGRGWCGWDGDGPSSDARTWLGSTCRRSEPIVRQDRCPLAAKVLPVSRSVGTRMVHTANFAGIGKGRRPQATCQREECEPFGVIPNYVINYLIVLIFINRVPFPLAAAL